MKMIRNLLAAAFLFAGLGATAQTADEIIAKNIDAMGGAAKLATLNSVKMTGTLSAQGNDIPLTMTRVHQKGFRLDLDIMGTSNYQIITPDKGYMFFPIQQMTEPKELDADVVKAAQGQLDLHGALVNYKEKGMTVEFGGTEKVDGNDAFKINTTDKNGKKVTYFFDAKTYRTVKTKSMTKGPDGSDMEVESTFSDYKQNADGYWFAYSTVTPNGPITFDKIETNIKVDENIFKN